MSGSARLQDDEERRARRRVLAEEMQVFLADWRDERGDDGWVPLRLVRVTGLMAWELVHAGLIEIDRGHARPLTRLFEDVA